MQKQQTWIGVLVAAALLAPTAPPAQAQDAAAKFVQVASSYRLVPNVTYLRAGGVDLKLDVYQARSASPRPTLLYIHGGGWTNGNKESSALTFLPYLEMG